MFPRILQGSPFFALTLVNKNGVLSSNAAVRVFRLSSSNPFHKSLFTSKLFHTTPFSQQDLLTAATQDVQVLNSKNLRDSSFEIYEKMQQTPPKEFIIKTRCLDTSVYKMNLAVRMLKGMTVNQAMNQLKFSKKKAAHWVLGRLTTLKKQAQEVYEVDSNRLEIIQTWVLKGKYYKDWRLHGRGRIGRMTHPSAFARLRVREVPVGLPLSTRLDGKRDLTEFEKIWIRLRRNKLSMPFVERKRVPYYRAPWSALPYKYLENPRWVVPKYPHEK